MSGTRRRQVDDPAPGGTGGLSADSDPESLARAIVLRQLTMAPRSRAQLATSLADRGMTDAVAERVLDRFEQVGLVDDAAFAAGLVRTRHLTRGLSRRAIAHELRAKGIEDDLARSALTYLDADDELRAAQRLVAQRLRTVQGLTRDKQVNRLVAMLARKGYSTGLSVQVVRAALADNEVDAGVEQPDDYS